MSDVPPSSEEPTEPAEGSPPALDYNRPISSGANTGCLVVSIILSVPVGLFAFLAVGLLSSGNQTWAMILAGGAVAVIVGAVVAARFGLNAAVAIFLAALCIFLLTLGICSSHSGFGV